MGPLGKKPINRAFPKCLGILTRVKWPASLVVILLVAVGAFFGGSRYSSRSLDPKSSNASRKPLYYACPMHPQYKSKTPGQAPCCGMRLEPVYADSGSPAAGDIPAGAIHVDTERQQLIGVRTASVERRREQHTIRTTGRVAADENRLYRVNASRELWIRKIYAPTTGSKVRKDEPLVEFWASNLFSAGESYLYAMDARDRLLKTDSKNTAQLQPLNYRLRQAFENLQSMGVSDFDIAEIERTRQPTNLVTLRSPTDGVVLSRSATMGDRVGASAELYLIADLSQVWVFADLFENEAAYVRPGLRLGSMRPRRTCRSPPR